MSESNAWLLHFNNKDSIAIGEQELLHILTEPDLLTIPKSKKYCQNLALWQDQILPVTNISGYVNTGESRISSIVGIIAYKDTDSNELKYSAIDLTSIPKKIKVDDNQQCQLPDTLMHWKNYTISCFEHNNKAIPIINLALFFKNTEHILN